MTDKIKVTIWNEFRHEKTNEAVKKLYDTHVAGDGLDDDGRDAIAVLVEELFDGFEVVVGREQGVLCEILRYARARRCA